MWRRTALAGIEDLREKRSEVQRHIREEEAQRDRIQKELSILTRDLNQLNNSMSRKVSNLSIDIAVCLA